MFALTALGARISDEATAASEVDEVVTNRHVASIGAGYFHVHSRSRVTRDGGHSILAIPDPDSTTRIGRVHTRSDSRSSESTVNVGSDGDRGGASAPSSASFPPWLPGHTRLYSASTTQPLMGASRPAVSPAVWSDTMAPGANAGFGRRSDLTLQHLSQYMPLAKVQGMIQSFQ